VTKITLTKLEIQFLCKNFRIYFKPGVTILRSEFTQLKSLCMKGRANSFLTISLLMAIFISCNKPNEDGPYTLSYGSPIIYLKNQSSDYIVYPAETRAGIYSAFPEGIEIDDNTGAINVSKSETGLKYKITHRASNGDTTSTIVLISGIQFLDKFYRLSQNDSIASPIYNGSAANPLPLSGSSFDDGGLANTGGCAVKTTNGQINLAETVRNGVFGSTPQNDAKREFEIEYKLNDESGKAKNKIKVKLYYYQTMADVAPDLLETLNDRQSQGVFLGMNNSVDTGNITTARTTNATAIAKPRPPCVIIIGQ
jgi:hypothetical protein